MNLHNVTSEQAYDLFHHSSLKMHAEGIQTGTLRRAAPQVLPGAFRQTEQGSTFRKGESHRPGNIRVPLGYPWIPMILRAEQAAMRFPPTATSGYVFSIITKHREAEIA